MFVRGGRIPRFALAVLVLGFLWGSRMARGDVVISAIRALESGDPVQAARLLERQVDQGNPEAEAMLGALYWLGEGVPQDFERALFLYERAAEAGLAVAQSSVAGILSGRRGPGFAETGLEADCADAVLWRLFAASQGFLDALYRQGSDLTIEDPTDEDCVGRDDYEAWRFLQQAATVELPNQRELVIEAMIALPHSDWGGLDVASKVSRYRVHLEQILARSMWSLGGLYRDGRGVPRDHVIALYWFNLAAEVMSNPHVAEAWRAKIRHFDAALTPDEIAEVRSLERTRGPSE